MFIVPHVLSTETTVTSEEFYTFFAQFGDIMDSVVMLDRETRRARGFGFVTFFDSSVCTTLLKMGGDSKDDATPRSGRSGKLEMRGKMIEIKAAQPKAGESAPPKTQNDHKVASTIPQDVLHPSLHQIYQSLPPVAPSLYEQKNPTKEAAAWGSHNPSLQTPFMKHPATLPPYSFPVVPQTPTLYAPATPVTPQAAFEMAHHMMFYSQLLATPTSLMGFEKQNYYQYHKSTGPTVQVSQVKSGQPFRIGDAGFYPESDIEEDPEDSLDDVSR